MSAPIDLSPLIRIAEETQPLRARGRVSKVVGLVVESAGPASSIGQVCTIITSDAGRRDAEVVGFRDRTVLLMPLGDVQGIKSGDVILGHDKPAVTPVGDALLGRVLDARGRPLDDRDLPQLPKKYPLMPAPPNPLHREPIRARLDTGVRSIDGLNACGKGQRIGLFAGSGVGKSTLTGMIARNTTADVNVIALVGERGREVREFIEGDLGPAGLARSVVVVATSDQSPLLRIRAAFLATSIAEYFKDQGKHVILMMDSVTRFAMAQREVGIAAGEPPSSRGYTPSVFALLPRLMERAGNFRSGGSITGFYTVLVEGDDMNEPISDACRSILDGHIALSRDLAHRNHYPAVDVLGSVSRLMSAVATPSHKAAAGKVREWLAVYRANEDLINIGAYKPGANPTLDEAIARYEAITTFLRQEVTDRAPFSETLEVLEAIAT
ncbi:MAG: FliI/YscN family ATPase [Candidatus Schekmanbacteria bacterium]|nr:FliI/YscN family ATPase [Candidatus Schekmanbacteria bacterium]